MCGLCGYVVVVLFGLACIEICFQEIIRSIADTWWIFSKFSFFSNKSFSRWILSWYAFGFSPSFWFTNLEKVLSFYEMLRNFELIFVCALSFAAKNWNEWNMRVVHSGSEESTAKQTSPSWKSRTTMKLITAVKWELFKTCDSLPDLGLQSNACLLGNQPWVNPWSKFYCALRVVAVVFLQSSHVRLLFWSRKFLPPNPMELAATCVVHMLFKRNLL